MLSKSLSRFATLKAFINKKACIFNDNEDKNGSYTHQSSLGLDERPILAVHLVVKSASVAQIMSGTISAPKWRRRGPTVDTLPTL